MQPPKSVADRPVRFALLAWAGVGLALVGYGLYDMYAFGCPSGECGSPVGFVLALWGLAILGLVMTVALGRVASRRLRDGDPADG